MQTVNRPELEAKIKSLSTPELPGYKTKIKSDYVSAGMLGLTFTWLTTGSISFSLSLGGIITSSSGFYNNTFLNGLEMMSVVAAVSYSANINSD